MSAEDTKAEEKQKSRNQRIHAFLPSQRQKATFSKTAREKYRRASDSRPLRRTASSGDTNKPWVERDGYYRPMTVPNRKKTKKFRSVCYSDGDQHEDDHLPALNQPSPAWDSFRYQISRLQGVDSTFNGEKQSFSTKASDIHNRVIKDLKEKSLRRKTKSIIMAAKLKKLSNIKFSDVVTEEADTDSEDEEEKEEALKRKLVAQRHWMVIRREIQDRIRKRKENNKANNSWNILRHQVRATTHAQAVRTELYAKYGVTGLPCITHSIEKPALSDEVKQLINHFESLEVRNIKHLQSSAKHRPLGQLTNPTISMTN